MLAPIRLGSFQSVYYVLFSKYFPNIIYVKTFKYILSPVSEFSFKCLKDLFQGTELTPGEAVLCVLQIGMDYQCDLRIGKCVFLLTDIFFYSKIALEC